MKHGQILDNAQVVTAACDRWLRARGIAVYTMKELIQGSCRSNFQKSAAVKKAEKEERLQSIDQEDGE
jgi:hypothetical protein